MKDWSQSLRLKRWLRPWAMLFYGFGAWITLLIHPDTDSAILGFFLALNWSYLYFTQLKSLR